MAVFALNAKKGRKQLWKERFIQIVTRIVGLQKIF